MLKKVHYARFFFFFFFFSQQMLFSRQPRQKRLPLEMVRSLFGYSFTRLGVFSSVSTAQQLLCFPQEAAILHFRTNSKWEGLGDFSLLSIMSNVDFLAGLLGILWLASGAVDSCLATTTTSTRPTIVWFYAAARTCSWQRHLTRVLFP